MSSSTNNTILFDFFSIVDKEVSLIKYIQNTGDLKDKFDISRLGIIDDDRLRFLRTMGTEDLIESIVINPESGYIKELNSVFFDKETDILKYAITTNMTKLISAYSIAGNGTIRTTIRCNNDTESSFIKKLIPNAEIIVREAKEVDLNKYSRIIIGDYIDTFNYVFDNPMSIGILDFRGNFTKKDNSLLNPELVISFGDINEIKIISSYNISVNPKG